MGGVSAHLLLKDKLTKGQEELLFKILRTISPDICDREFWVTDTNLIGGSYTGEPRPFFFVIDTIKQRDESDINQVKEKLDFDAMHEISINANANGQDDPRILGELVYWISKEFNGLIDFGDLLLPNKYYKDHGYLKDIEFEEAMHYVNAMKGNVTGRLVEIKYKTSDKIWASHVGDAEFMKNWLKSDDFKMVK